MLPTYRSVDIMKLTKDTVTNQPSEASLQQLIEELSQINLTHIAISVPLDEHISGESPDSTWVFTKKVADLIHAAGLKVLFRGTFAALEGIYGVQKAVGPNRQPQSYWLGLISDYITNNPDLFQDGDIWAPLPEQTGHGIFQDSTSFLEGPLPDNYATFFIDVKNTSDTAFNTIGKNVVTGQTANNYTEVASGWIFQSLFDAIGVLSIDHYESDMTTLEQNIRDINTNKGQPVFHQEWADINDNGNIAEYLQLMDQLAGEGIVVGVNYWGGWAGTNESVVDFVNNQYILNEDGLALKAAWEVEEEGEELEYVTDSAYVNEPGVLVLATGPGFLHHITINEASEGRIRAYDGEDENGDLLTNLREYAPEQTYHYNSPFDDGLVIEKLQASGNISVSFTTISA